MLRALKRSNRVSASHSYPRSTGPAQPVGRDERPAGPGRNVCLIVGFNRFLVKLACPSHAWSWPRPIPGEPSSGFDAHQTCFKCSTERFYNTSTLQAGPLYRSTAAETRRRPGAGSAPVDALRRTLGLAADLGRELVKRAKSLRA
jgi:hypothetical protein